MAEPVGPVSSDAEAPSLCVLVLEDNDQVGDFAAEALRELGHDVVRTSGAEQALQRLAGPGINFDVVFCDVVMTGMSGLELAQRIRRTRRDLPVILTSGYSHVLAQNGSPGFELLHKLYSTEQLSRVLQKSTAWKR